VDSREKALAWVRDLTTKNGTSRAAAIAGCGALEVMYHARDAAWGYAQRWCRDRACPVCQRHRSTRKRSSLEHFHDEVHDHGDGQLLFLTFTQTKRAAAIEGPGEAVDRILARWKRWQNRRPVKRMVRGWVRALECVWIPRGWRYSTRTGKRYFVEESGWHAHLHVIAHVRGATFGGIGELRELWNGARAEGEPDEPLALHIQGFNRSRLAQIAKYITKPFELPATHAPVFFRELAGRRILGAGGTWRDALKVAPPNPDGWTPMRTHPAEVVRAAIEGVALLSLPAVALALDVATREAVALRPVVTGDDTVCDAAVRIEARPVEILRGIVDRLPVRGLELAEPRGPPS